MAPTRLSVLDGLRGIAILLVLWYHVWEISWLPAPLRALQFIPETGFAGVDLFFYISGFVIVYPFVKASFAGEPQPGWTHFAFRRGIKILPSYLLSIVAAIAVGYAHFASPGEAARDLVTHLLFIHIWWPQTYGAINGVLWTLAVEVQFYAAFPLIWFFFRRRPFATAAVMTAEALIFRRQAELCCLHTSAGLLITNLPAYLDTFAAGMLSAHLFVRWRDRAAPAAAQAAATFAAAAGFAALAVLLQNLWAMRLAEDWSTVWQVNNRTLLAAAFLLIGLGSLLALPLWKRLIANPVLLFFAAISYNLYLYHQMVARELLAAHVPPYRGSDQHGDPHWELWFTIVAFVVTVVQATLVTYLFERPLLRIRWEQLNVAASRLRRRGVLSGM
jgi:peptidoglycan/LPS O-acetylase OafA/YrhL